MTFNTSAIKFAVAMNTPKSTVGTSVIKNNPYLAIGAHVSSGISTLFSSGNPLKGFLIHIINLTLSFVTTVTKVGTRNVQKYLQ